MAQVKYRWDFVWRNIAILSLVHIYSVYGLYYLLSGTAHWKTSVFGLLYALFGAFGTTAGSHRLWTHRAYKAKLPLRILLCIQQSSTLQTPIYEWVRDHRVHHKFTDTDGDPHNASRGFFFSHVGWLLVRKHRDVIEKGKQVDMSDILEDKVVMFQKKYYAWITLPLSLGLPTLIPWYYWNESFFVSWCVAAMLRYVIILHVIWSVNSVAHIWGNKPYDKDILPSENLFVGIMALGEGWHNYHHVFPWDYKTSELGDYTYNLSTAYIDLMCKMGLAYDLKTVSDDVIKARSLRTGDGTKYVEPTTPVPEDMAIDRNIWGWGDHDIKPEMEKYIINADESVIHPKN